MPAINASAHPARSLPPGPRRLAGLALTWALLAAATARADSVFTVSAWLEIADSALAPYGDYAVKNDPLDHVRAVLQDPDRLLAGRVPARRAFSATLLQPRKPEDVPAFRVLREETVPGGIAPSSLSPWVASTSEQFKPSAGILPRVLTISSNPAADTDGDGVPDRQDVFPFDPTEWADADGDGIGDNADPDDDNDGMTDAYEGRVGLDPFKADAAGDLDRDGVSNLAEAVAGTLANDSRSRFALEVRLDPRRGQLAISWNGLANRIYGFESADSPAGPWFPLTSGFQPAADGPVSTTSRIKEGQSFIRGTVSIP